MNILAIDPSSTILGWASNAFGEDDHGVIEAPGKIPRPNRLQIIMEELAGIFREARFDAVVFYTPFARGKDATRSQWGIAGIIEALATEHGSAVLDVYEGTVRAFHGFKLPLKLAKGERRLHLKALALAKVAELGYHNVKSDDIADAILLLEYVKAKIKVKGA